MLYKCFHMKKIKLFTGVFSIFLTIAILFYDAFLIFGLYPKKDEVKKAKTVKVNYSILIDTEERRLYILNNGKFYCSYPCAIGKKETPSPLGKYIIKEKSHWGKGFGGFWMGLDCPWGNYGIHGTTKPDSVGLPSSHGCFRMRNEDVAAVYKIIPVGTPVYISGGCYGGFGSSMRDIKPFMFGRDVQLLQLRLKEQNYYTGNCNGRYDTQEMKSAIHKFQKNNGLTVSDSANKKMLTMLGLILMD